MVPIKNGMQKLLKDTKLYQEVDTVLHSKYILVMFALITRA